MGKRFDLQEASGQVQMGTEEGLQPLEGVKVNFLDHNGHFLTSVASGRNGRFGFLGLRPGTYRAQLDSAQLKRLGLHALKGSLVFHIGRETAGDEQLNFVLQKAEAATEGKTALSAQPSQEGPNACELIYRVQVAASNVRLSVNHPALRQKRGLEMHVHQGQYKYTFGKTSSMTEALEIQEQLQREGFAEAFVVAFRGKERLSQAELEALDCR